MVLSIIATVFSVGHIVANGMGLGLDDRVYDHYNCERISTTYYYDHEYGYPQRSSYRIYSPECESRVSHHGYRMFFQITLYHYELVKSFNALMTMIICRSHDLEASRFLYGS